MKEQKTPTQKQSYGSVKPNWFSRRSAIDLPLDFWV